MAETGSRATPTWSKSIDEAIEAKLLELHTAMPAEIVAYDPDTAYAKIKVHFKRKYKGQDSPVSIPVISGVPVLMPRTAKAHLRLPIAKGDKGLAVFAERSMDRWVESATDQDPNDARRHALSDPIFIPGIYDQQTEITGDARADSIELRNRSGFAEILVNGKLKIGNNREELISLQKDFIDAVKGATVTVTGGSSAGTYPLSPATVSALATIASRILNLKGA